MAGASIVVGKKSQCCNCSKVFVVTNEKLVCYCSRKCEFEHDLFYWKPAAILPNESGR